MSVEEVPRQLGSYRIIAKLGAGGMANVYLGMQSGMAKFKKLVVVKVLHPNHVANAEFLSMFLNEARLAARLNHPNVVNTYEVGEDDGRHFMAMEYLEGQPFNAVIKKIGRDKIPCDHVLKVLVDVLAGLHYAHELRDFDGTHLGVVHRDVSPQNIFITYDGNTKLVDFGVAKAACSDMETRAGVIKGKIAYLSPEQAGADPVDRRADIFSVGVLLWETLARKRFSSGAIDVATIHKRVTGGEPRIREVMPDVPSDLADICDKAIALRPDDRFATALEMKEALETVLESRRERAKTHSLAVLVTEAFAEERSTIKTVIEQHAKVAHSEPPGKTGSNVIPVLSPQPSDASNPTGSLPSATSIGGASVVTGDVRPPKASIMPWLAVVAVVGIAGATIAYVVSQGDSAASTTVPPPSSTAAVVQKPDDAKVELIVIASPPEAVITLDGTQLSSNPFRAQVDRGSQMHKILAKADGYVEQEKVVVFDQNLTVKLTLERTDNTDKGAVAKPAVGGGKTVAAAAPGTPGTAPTTTAPAGATAGDRLRTNRDTGKPTRTIDDKDPYAQ